MLTNLTNHPSIKWQSAQLQLAQQKFGTVEDMPFPNIDPLFSAEQIKKLAFDYCTKIVELKPKAVHLMGEMTFTHTLVSMLQKQDIECVASTSERRVIEEENGKKTVVFEFKQFRQYPKI